jgi:hypothetical protein
MIITPYAAAHGDGEQKVVQSPEGGETIFCIAAFGALDTALSFTPGYTGGHHCFDPSGLELREDY